MVFIYGPIVSCAVISNGTDELFSDDFSCGSDRQRVKKALFQLIKGSQRLS
jgi:hypothetical protein